MSLADYIPLQTFKKCWRTGITNEIEIKENKINMKELKIHHLNSMLSMALPTDSNPFFFLCLLDPITEVYPLNYVLLQVEEKRCFSCMQSAEAFLPLIFELMMCILTSIAALQFGVRRGYEMISFEVFALIWFLDLMIFEVL